MQVSFDYGRTGLEVTVPAEIPADRVTVLRDADTPALPDPRAEITRQLETPLGAPPLWEIVQVSAARTACVVVSDATRPVPTRELLPPILEQFARAGLPADRVTVLIATGLHRPSTAEEIARIVGPALAGKLTVVNHDAKDPGQLAWLAGDAESSTVGVPVQLNKHYLEADVRVLTGYVDPHFFAGFAGGRKSVVPGIASFQTIMHNHSAEHVADPRARFGVLEGNPIHEHALAVARRARVDFVVNVLINAGHEITAVAAGDLTRVHRALVSELEGRVFHPVPAPFDVVVCGNGGYPLDLNLYQAVKSMAIGELGVRPGGTIISVNECSDGVGHPRFRELLDSSLTPREMYKRVTRGEITCDDQWEIQILARVLAHATVRVVSELPESALGTLGLKHNATVEEALRAAWEETGGNGRVLILPNGPAVLPRVTSSVISNA